MARSVFFDNQENLGTKLGLGCYKAVFVSLLESLKACENIFLAMQTTFSLYFTGYI